MRKRASPELQEHLFQAIRTQIETNTPPQTKQTYDRLLGEGIADKDAHVHLIRALVYELFVMMKEERPFNEENYAKLLDRLPNLD